MDHDFVRERLNALIIERRLNPQDISIKAGMGEQRLQGRLRGGGEASPGIIGHDGGVSRDARRRCIAPPVTGFFAACL